MIKCFLIETSGLTLRHLRRYCSSDTEQSKCPVHTYHDATNLIGKGTVGVDHEHDHVEFYDKRDPQWPTKCDCGYIFQDTDTWQVFDPHEYRRADDHATSFRLHDAQPGAIWRAEWYESFWHGADGKCYVCKTPGGEWIIDGRASNCGLPDDDIHKCWVRHGEAPNFTVDKNGNTCVAGAGSIQQGGYHGFLREGFLT